MGSGGHQTDSKPASVLANEASIEVENRQNCQTHYGIKGIIASAFADASQVGRIQTFVLSQKTNSTAKSKCKSGRVNKFAERLAIIGLHIFTVKLLRAQNPKRQTPGAGRRVQSGAQPDEASNRLTRRPATYHRIPIHAHAARDCATRKLF